MSPDRRRQNASIRVTLRASVRSPSAPVLDPFKAHPTYRTSLPGEQKAPFDVEVKRLDALLARSAGNGAG